MRFRHAAIVAAALFATAGMTYAQSDADQPTTKHMEKSAKQSATLKVGDKAPALSIDKWVKGDPVTGFEKGKTYVVEFWATWCGPCVESMPHLSTLQKEYKDQGVTIIGVTTEDSRGNTLEKVKEMVQAKGDTMGYTVAWDDGRKTNNDYMKAADQHGIPTAFVVNGDGKIAYIGHPMWLDIPLKEISQGTWDTEKGMARIEQAQKQLQEIFEAAQDDPKEGLSKFKAFEKEYPAAAGMFSDMKYQLMVKANDPEAAQLAGKMVDEAVKTKDAQKLNQIAWGIVDPKAEVEHRDLSLAMRAASKAVEITDRKDPAILDTLAWAYYHQGDKDKAAQTEKEAIEALKTSKQYEGDAKDQLQSELDENLKTFQGDKDSK